MRAGQGKGGKTNAGGNRERTLEKNHPAWIQEHGEHVSPFRGRAATFSQRVKVQPRKKTLRWKKNFHNEAAGFDNRRSTAVQKSSEKTE